MVNVTCSHGKSDIRKQVRELRSAYLCMTMSEIAKKVGVSRQRVYQILQKDGFPTKHQHYVRKNLYECPVCGTTSEHKFCSDACKNKWQQIPVICSRCGKLFSRNRRVLLRNYRRHSRALFCSRYCIGMWLAENYSSNKRYLKPYNVGV